MKKNILAINLIFFFINSNAQFINWQHKDLETDSVFGISTDKAYRELPMASVRESVIVAVIDTGVDTLHEDLKGVLWTDPKTGIHGWNYIGAETGREDITMIVANKKKFYDSLSHTSVSELNRQEYQSYRKNTAALKNKIYAMKDLITQLEEIDTEGARQLKALAQYHLDHGLNIKNLEPDTAAGNADVSPDKIAPLPDANITPFHGTHVAGIIAAERGNEKGLDGVADNVKVMTLKVNGNIRELRDKSLSRAIRFAVDHGAKVINLSFGKPYTWAKKEVDEAIAYAGRNDVLLLHAAGNNKQNLDEIEHYPDPADKSNWILVAASGSKDDNTLPAVFSNYGKKTVDVFAPGVDIYSTVPGNTYGTWSGTSMATPMVAGLAALIRSYYPKLTATQVKEIIMKSVVKRDILKDKCVSGGIVNAYNALKLAATYK